MVMKLISTIKSAMSDPAAEASTDKAILYFDHPDTGMVQVPCQFNPESLVVTKKSDWNLKAQPDRDSPLLIFSGGQPAQFSLDLFFDTTGLNNVDVRVFTNSLLRLTLKGAGAANPDDEDPPIVGFIWGKFQLFQAVLVQLEIRYTMFLKNGTPVRARAKASFVQYSKDKGAQNPTTRTDPRKTYVIQAGDRLDYIAYRQLGSAARWREIAQANDLPDPLDLKPGQVLVIPQEF